MSRIGLDKLADRREHFQIAVLYLLGQILLSFEPQPQHLVLIRKIRTPSLPPMAVARLALAGRNLLNLNLAGPDAFGMLERTRCVTPFFP